ncbi:MAG: DNA repair protein RadA, partial [Clostridia bacterium]|nr:DNA repair protein RadA [Clostridia bacterium]
PLLVELQALLNVTSYATPLRMAQGIERNRLSMLLAVVEKKLGLGLGNLDAYLNVVGGLKISETAADLAIVSAVISSVKNRPVKAQTIILGEIGLAGEVRSVSQLDRRISEASRLGFDYFLVPASSRTALAKVKLPDSCEIYYIDKMTEALDILFE